MIDPSNIPPAATHGKQVRSRLNVPLIPTLPSTATPSSLPNPLYPIPI